jgi:hypothetical protein
MHLLNSREGERERKRNNANSLNEKKTEVPHNSSLKT